MGGALIGMAAGIGYVTSQQFKSYETRYDKYNKVGSIMPGYKTPAYKSNSIALTCAKNQFQVTTYTGTLNGLAKSSLIKIEGAPAVYWYAKDGKRYVFPNLATYRTWYSDATGQPCPMIQEIPLSMMVQITIGGNVRMKPVWTFVKITTDPKVFAVSKGGVLHWIESEKLAASFIQPDWRKFVRDVPDAFFVNYTIGSSLSSAADWTKYIVPSNAVKTIDQDLGL